MIALFVVAFSIRLPHATLIHHGPGATPRPACGIEAVAYRFVGAAGSTFEYGGETFVLPAPGSIELIADPRSAEYRIADRMLPLNVWPRDEFGIRTISLRAHR